MVQTGNELIQQIFGRLEDVNLIWCDIKPIEINALLKFPKDVGQQKILSIQKQEVIGLGWQMNPSLNVGILMNK